MLFRKQKTQPDITYPYGFSAYAQPITTLSNRAVICLIKGLIIFAATFGTIDAVISSFALPCHIFVIMLGLLLISLGLSFIHYNRIIFNTCYPLLFFIFVFCIIRFRYHVNSGYQAFLSIMQEEYSTYFDLSILRQTQETIANRTVTITYAALFIGFFWAILLNIAVSEYMSLIGVILLTFPIYQLGLYIDLMPNMISTTCLIASYFMVGTLKLSEHFLLPYRDKKFTEFKVKEKKGIKWHTYYASGRVMYQMALTFLIFTMLVMALSIPMLLHANASIGKNSLRKTADKYIENITQSGISSFFNRYQATGGISEGRLGGISSVRPDYQTDLTITFVPFAYETLYLKAFTGGDYTGNQWEYPNFEQRNIKNTLGSKFFAFSTYTSVLEANRLKLYSDTHKGAGIYAKMKVENLDANENCLYLPYYTTLDISQEYATPQSVIRGKFPVNANYTLSYYPLLHNYWPVNQAPDEIKEYYGKNHIYSQYIEQYDAFCYDNYRYIPSELNTYLQSLHKTIGFANSVEEQIVMIQVFLAKNYKYDMQPGTTPYRQDFVQYFLETQKRGYCAHFASAAALLLRSYDIPARYVEGYAVPFSEIAEGSAVDEKYEDWFVGDNPIEKSAVISVNVTDADAHAWVEVYRPGIGWVPYEFTPPSTDEDRTPSGYDGFWSIFSNLMATNDSQVQTPDEISETLGANKRFIHRMENTFLMPFFIFIACLCLAISMTLFIRVIVFRLKLAIAFKKGDYAPLLAFYYQKITKCLLSRHLITSDILLPGKFCDLHTEKVIPLANTSAQLPAINQIKTSMDLLEICLYSPQNITNKQADEVLQFLKQYRKLLSQIKEQR